jgi:hypothetical protein
VLLFKTFKKQMNALVTSFDSFPKLGEALRENREKWKQITDCKKWLTTLPLSIATSLRGANLFLELFGWGMMGASAMTGAVAATLDAQETHYYYRDSGLYAGSKKNCENMACLFTMITIACFLAGAGAIVASVLCWLLAYLFIFLSFLWCFRTDLEFEQTTAQKITSLKSQIKDTEYSHPEHEGEHYAAAFEKAKAAKLEKLREQLSAFEEKTQQEREKRESRSGKRSPGRAKNLRSVGVAPDPDSDPAPMPVLVPVEEPGARYDVPVAVQCNNGEEAV